MDSDYGIARWEMAIERFAGNWRNSRRELLQGRARQQKANRNGEKLTADASAIR